MLLVRELRLKNPVQPSDMLQHICLYAHIQTHTEIYIYIYVCMYICVYTYIYIYICIYIFIYICIYIHIVIYFYMCVCLCVNICTHTRSRTWCQVSQRYSCPVYLYSLVLDVCMYIFIYVRVYRCVCTQNVEILAPLSQPKCLAMCCGVLQCAAELLQRVTGYCSVLKRVAA